MSVNMLFFKGAFFWLLWGVNIIVPDGNASVLSLWQWRHTLLFLRWGDAANHVEHVWALYVIFTFRCLYTFVFLADVLCVWKNSSRQTCCFVTLWVTARIPSVKAKCVIMNVSLQAKWCAIKQSQKQTKHWLHSSRFMSVSEHTAPDLITRLKTRSHDRPVEPDHSSLCCWASLFVTWSESMMGNKPRRELQVEAFHPQSHRVAFDYFGGLHDGKRLQNVLISTAAVKTILPQQTVSVSLLWPKQRSSDVI